MLELKEVIIAVTNRCNSSCRMCDIPKEKVEELSFLEWGGAIKDISILGVPTVVFSGGEPLLREDIFRLISLVKMNHMDACVTSNGLMINKKNAFNLSSAGVDVVNVSIEGPREIHNYLRGEGTFEKAICALDNLRKYNIESTVATVVSSHNYKHLSDIVELAAKYGATTIKFQPFSTMFIKNESQESTFLLSRKESIDFKHIIKKVILRCDEYGIVTNPVSYLERMSLYLNKNFPSRNVICSALWNCCPVNPRGDIYPCWGMAREDVLIGSIKEKSFLELWNSSRHNLVREKIKKDGCSGCMMSCYDESFGKDNIERKVTMRIKKLKKGICSGQAGGILKRWVKRAKFYYSYRGSLNMFTKRLRRFFRRKKLPRTEPNKEEIERALKETRTVKEIFKKEMECLR